MKIKLIFITFLCCYLFLISCDVHQPDNGIPAKVQRVVSGQTIDVLINNSNLQERVRLIGIDSPDLKQQSWGINAKNKLAEWLNQERIILELEEPKEDQFGRKLAHVWHNQELINEKLIAQGYALNALDYENKYSKKYQRAQEFARLMGHGIWNHDNPMRQTPREFRSQN
jgi:micrococcal nuclease